MIVYASSKKWTHVFTHSQVCRMLLHLVSMFLQDMQPGTGLAARVVLGFVCFCMCYYVQYLLHVCYFIVGSTHTHDVCVCQRVQTDRQTDTHVSNVCINVYTCASKRQSEGHIDTKETWEWERRTDRHKRDVRVREKDRQTQKRSERTDRHKREVGVREGQTEPIQWSETQPYALICYICLNAYAHTKPITGHLHTNHTHA